MWTKERMLQLLRTNDLAVERALIVIYDRQTQDEKRDKDTKHHNDVGFRANHASTASYFSRIILKGWTFLDGRKRVHLRSDKLDKARHIVLQYTRQLCDEANRREAEKCRSTAT